MSQINIAPIAGISVSQPGQKTVFNQLLTSTCVDKQNYQNIEEKVYNSIWIQTDLII